MGEIFNPTPSENMLSKTNNVKAKEAIKKLKDEGEKFNVNEFKGGEKFPKPKFDEYGEIILEEDENNGLTKEEQQQQEEFRKIRKELEAGGN